MTQTYYVDPTAGSNGDGSQGSPFSTLRNARVALQTAFNSATEDYIVNCLAGSDAGDGTQLTWTIGAGGTSRNLIIQATGANKHTGVRSSGYRGTQSFKVINNNTSVTAQLIGLAGTQFLFDSSTGTTHIADACLAYDMAAQYGYYLGGGTATFKNCTVYKAGNAGFLQETNTSTPTGTYLNCTALACSTYGWQRTGGTATLKNCASAGNTTDAYTGTMTRTTCVHSSATVFSGSTASVAYSTANYTNVTASSENGKLPSGSALIGAGTGPGSDAAIPTVDFEGDTRSGSTTDVGFDQFVAASSGILRQMIMQH